MAHEVTSGLATKYVIQVKWLDYTAQPVPAPPTQLHRAPMQVYEPFTVGPA